MARRYQVINPEGNLGSTLAAHHDRHSHLNEELATAGDEAIAADDLAVVHAQMAEGVEHDHQLAAAAYKAADDVRAQVSNLTLLDYAVAPDKREIREVVGRLQIDCQLAAVVS